jgi:hypothetical protein
MSTLIDDFSLQLALQEKKHSCDTVNPQREITVPVTNKKTPRIAPLIACLLPLLESILMGSVMIHGGQ